MGPWPLVVLFVCLALGAGLVVLARKGGTAARVAALPSTGLGRASAWLFLAAIVLMVLGSTVLQGAWPTVGAVNVGPLVSVVVLLAALVTGAIAIVRSRERSWVVWLAVVLPALVLGAEIISMVIPGD